MVGDVFQQAFRNRWLDAKVEFDIPRPKPPPPPEPEPQQDPLSNLVNEIMNRIRPLLGD
jgi:penicillin-binding protein 1A